MRCTAGARGPGTVTYVVKHTRIIQWLGISNTALGSAIVLLKGEVSTGEKGCW